MPRAKSIILGQDKLIIEPLKFLIHHISSLNSLMYHVIFILSSIIVCISLIKIVFDTVQTNLVANFQTIVYNLHLFVKGNNYFTDTK